MIKPLYLLISVIAFIACAHYRDDSLLMNVIFSFIGGVAFFRSYQDDE
jgi:hypothetical protein